MPAQPGFEAYGKEWKTPGNPNYTLLNAIAGGLKGYAARQDSERESALKREQMQQTILANVLPTLVGQGMPYKNAAAGINWTPPTINYRGSNIPVSQLSDVAAYEKAMNSANGGLPPGVSPIDFLEGAREAGMSGSYDPTDGWKLGVGKDQYGNFLPDEMSPSSEKLRGLFSQKKKSTEFSDTEIKDSIAFLEKNKTPRNEIAAFLTSHGIDPNAYGYGGNAPTSASASKSNFWNLSPEERKVLSSVKSGASKLSQIGQGWAENLKKTMGV